MKTKSILAVAVMACGLFSGCKMPHVDVPANTVRFKTPHGELDLEHPQNTDMHGVDVAMGTNGTITVHIESLHTINSPEVIDKTAAGQVALEKARGDTYVKIFKAGAESLGTLTGTTVGTAAKTAK